VTITHVLETHNHADHVSGHGRLARATGAQIHIHELAAAEYPHEAFADGWTLRLGQVEIEALHTPGHRPEHTSFLLRDRSRGGGRWAVLSGDSLFVGDVARPDLAVDAREGAIDIHRSLHERLFTLAAEVEVWPGHLGGSLCGSAGIDHKSNSTIGFERENNRAARFSSLEDFVEDAVQTIGDPPPTVEHVVALNRGPLIEELGQPAPLTPRAVEVASAEGALLVDARTNDQFDEAHIPGAISASAYDTGFATKVARVVPADVELIVVAASDGYELEAAELLASVGLRVRGFLSGGMTAWRSEGRPVQRLETIDPAALAERLEDGEGLLVLDVRDGADYAGGHIPGSVNIPYGSLVGRLRDLPVDRPIAAVCSAGKRSGLAASILQREGFDSVIHVGPGGVGTWRDAGRPLSTATNGSN
jgi:rhodanese-related sulfurtransferase/glyoxylase-like metal-dependent hydrolase (beta-lactamase superfamily II)